MATTLLARCAGIRLLATSRQAMRIAGEAVYSLAPLDVPAPAVHADEGAASDAFLLLTERAALAAPGFVVVEDNRPLIFELCRRLDGIPLALELAAVRLRVMTPAELLNHLHHHRDILDVGSRGAPDRHRTMTACLTWSYTLRSEEEPALWCSLAIFSGGVEMDAIQFIARQQHGLAAAAVVDIVHSLVDKSVLTRREIEGTTRHQMLDLLREFGSDQLERSDRLHEARRGHRDWCVELLQECEAGWMSPDQTHFMRRLRREEANLRQALTFCMSDPVESRVGLAMAAQLRTHAVAHGLFSEVRVWLDRLLALVSERGPLRLRGVRAACWLAAMHGDRSAAAELVTECEQLAGELGGLAVSLTDQVGGLCALFAGDQVAAVTRLSRALRGFADPTQAGESWYLSYSLWHDGLVSWRQGEPDRAIGMEEESLRLKRSLGERLGVAVCLEALAWMSVEVAPAQAARLMGAAESLWKAMGTSIDALPGLVPLQRECRAQLTERLGDTSADKELPQGRLMDVQAAIAYALHEAPAAQPVVRAAAAGERGPTLTKREQEVADLLAAGLSNREIAAKLVISTRTAESHVENILIKLGFSPAHRWPPGWRTEARGPAPRHHDVTGGRALMTGPTARQSAPLNRGRLAR